MCTCGCTQRLRRVSIAPESLPPGAHERSQTAALVKHIGQARRLREQLDKRGDGRIVGQFADAGLYEDDLKDRDKRASIAAEPPPGVHTNDRAPRSRMDCRLPVHT